MLQRVLGISLAITLLVGGGIAAREVMRPASVIVDEQRIALEPGTVSSIHARASGGLPFGDGLHWQIVPSWLGTMNENGDFRAGALTGSGTVTAQFGSARAEVAVTVTCPKEARVSGVRFTVACGRSADVYVDVIAYGGAPAAAASVDRDADRVARDLGIPIERRFRVYYLGSRQGFTAVVPEIGRSFSAAPGVLESDAVYIDLADAIAIDQSQDPLMQTEGALRHELVHRLVRQLVGYANVDEIPSWLNEGWAFVEESSQTSRLKMEARLVSASMAHVGKLPSLRSLTSQYEWNDRTGLIGLYQYYAAAQATQFLIDDITLTGLHRILKRVRDGESFAEAFGHSAPGVNFGDFQDRFSERVAALVQTYPGMVASPGTPYGPGTTVIAYGLTPNASATLKAMGPIERKLIDDVDAYGVFVEYIGAEFPVGDYQVTLETEGRTLQVAARR